MLYATTGDIVLCEPAQSKCTWTCHKSNFVWKFSRKRPYATSRGIYNIYTALNEHRALTPTVRTPQCGHAVWGITACMATIHPKVGTSWKCRLKHVESLIDSADSPRILGINPCPNSKTPQHRPSIRALGRNLWPWPQSRSAKYEPPCLFPLPGGIRPDIPFTWTGPWFYAGMHWGEVGPHFALLILLPTTWLPGHASMHVWTTRHCNNINAWSEN